ncbi:hypothetical protein Tco_1541813 [Tanacetum coccineum]
MLQKCHGHGLTKGAIIQIFYHGVDEYTQAIMNGTAGGIFLYKRPNQAFQLLEDKVPFKLDCKYGAIGEEDTMYLRLNFTRNHEDLKSNTPYPEEDECMTRSSIKELFTPFEEPERVFHSTRKLFKTPSLEYSSLPKFNLFSDHEDQSEEEVAEAMGEPTMEEYMTKTREDYGSGIARPKIDDKAHFELKG